MNITSDEQHTLNRCYVEIMTALIEIETIQHKNAALEHVQSTLSDIENTLHRYVGPVSKGEQ